MKQAIRFFSIGLLIATLLMFSYYHFFDEKNDNDTKVVTTELTVEEMIEQVEDDGFKVISNEQYIALTLTEETSDSDKKEKSDKKKDNGKDKDKKKKDKDKEKEKDEEEEEEILGLITHTFVTDDDVLATDIAAELEENNIIDDKYEFLDYLDENNYMRFVQIGEFTVSNDMSFKEIAEIITTYPGT